MPFFVIGLALSICMFLLAKGNPFPYTFYLFLLLGIIFLFFTEKHKERGLISFVVVAGLTMPYGIFLLLGAAAIYNAPKHNSFHFYDRKYSVITFIISLIILSIISFNDNSYSRSEKIEFLYIYIPTMFFVMINALYIYFKKVIIDENSVHIRLPFSSKKTKIEFKRIKKIDYKKNEISIYYIDEKSSSKKQIDINTLGMTSLDKYNLKFLLEEGIKKEIEKNKVVKSENKDLNTLNETQELVVENSSQNIQEPINKKIFFVFPIVFVIFTSIIIYSLSPDTEQKQIEKLLKDPNSFVDMKNPSENVKKFAIRLNAWNILHIENPSYEMEKLVIREYLQNIELLKNPSERIQLDLINIDPYAIKYLKNPTIKVQEEAVKLNGLAIQYIQNPSENMKLEAVKNHPKALKYIKNQSMEMIETSINMNFNFIEFAEKIPERFYLDAVIVDANSIQKMENPSEDLKFLAISKNPNLIKDMNNPSEYLKILAVYISPNQFEFFENPSEDLKLLAVSKNPKLIEHITNPSEYVQLVAIRKDPYALKNIKNPSEQIKLEAIRDEPYVISIIENPSEELQLEAIKQDSRVFSLIKNPSDEVLKYYEKYRDVKSTNVKNRQKEINFLIPEHEIKDKNISNHLDILYKIDKNPKYINEIKNKTISMEFAFIKKKGLSNIDQMENPSKTVQYMAIEKGYTSKLNRIDEDIKRLVYRINVSQIKDFDEIDEEIQLKIIRNKITDYVYIKNPSEKVQAIILKYKEEQEKDKKNKKERSQSEYLEMFIENVIFPQIIGR